MKKNKLKPAQYIGLCVLCLPLFCSCRAFMGDNAFPSPEQNPLCISNDAQTIVTRIGNLEGLRAQNPEQDKVIKNIPTTGNTGGWTRIEADWIILFQSWDRYESDKVEITVKENTTGESRTYVLGIASKMKESTLTIIQNANK